MNTIDSIKIKCLVCQDKGKIKIKNPVSHFGNLNKIKIAKKDEVISYIDCPNCRDKFGNIKPDHELE